MLPLSKLLNVTFTRTLNARISASTSLIVDTGYCYSELHRTLSFPMKVVDGSVEKALVFTSEEGIRQLVYAAIRGRKDESQMRRAYIHLSKINGEIL